MKDKDTALLENAYSKIVKEDLDETGSSYDASDAAERILEIASEIDELIQEARRLTSQYAPDSYDTFEAYVFEQLEEHVRKSNRYNSDLTDVARAIEGAVYGDEDGDDY
jgi:signal transduction histidine kinase